MKIGDRVEVTTLPRFINKFIKVGDTGRIITYREMSGRIFVGVEFDKCINGHNCNSICKDNHCAWISKNYLKVI